MYQYLHGNLPSSEGLFSRGKLRLAHFLLQCIVPFQFTEAILSFWLSASGSEHTDPMEFGSDSERNGEKVLKQFAEAKSLLTAGKRWSGVVEKSLPAGS